MITNALAMSKRANPYSARGSIIPSKHTTEKEYRPELLLSPGQWQITFIEAGKYLRRNCCNWKMMMATVVYSQNWKKQAI
jgi:hypothetical protein